MPNSRYRQRQRHHNKTNTKQKNQPQSMSTTNTVDSHNDIPITTSSNESIDIITLPPHLIEWSQWTARMEQILDAKELIRAFVYPALSTTGELQGGFLTIFMNCHQLSQVERDALKQELQCPAHIQVDFMFIQNVARRC